MIEPFFISDQKSNNASGKNLDCLMIIFYCLLLLNHSLNFSLDSCQRHVEKYVDRTYSGLSIGMINYMHSL